MGIPIKAAISGQTSAWATSRRWRCDSCQCGGVVELVEGRGRATPDPHTTSGISVSLAEPAPCDPVNIHHMRWVFKNLCYNLVVGLYKKFKNYKIYTKLNKFFYFNVLLFNVLAYPHSCQEGNLIYQCSTKRTNLKE